MFSDLRDGTKHVCETTMTDGDGLLTRSLNPALFTALGVAMVVCGLTVFDDWLPLAAGAAIVVGGLGSLVAERSGRSGRSAIAPMVAAMAAVGALLLWNGYRSGVLITPLVGIGILAWVALFTVAPARQSLRRLVFPTVFGAAGVMFVWDGEFLYAAVMLLWAGLFGRLWYRNRGDD